MTQETAPAHDDAQQHDDGAQQPDPPRQDPPQDDGRSPSERTVPYTRFAEVNKQAKTNQRMVEELRERLEGLEAKDQTELEKERAKRQRFERELGELSEKMTRKEREGWITSAARDAKFDDPDDATAFIDFKDVEDYEDAVQAVKDLARRKPKLLRSESPPQNIGQVVKDGQQVRQQRQGDQTGQEITPESAAFLDQLKGAMAQSGWQSLPFE